MLAAIAFLLGLIALILKVVGTHGSWIQWMLIIGLMLVSAAVAWDWGRPWWTGRRQPPAA